MQLCFQEMHRVLKSGGMAAIVIGNTELKKVPILNSLLDAGKPLDEALDEKLNLIGDVNEIVHS
jgi:tRNA G10  N-methylase Trm11